MRIKNTTPWRHVILNALEDWIFKVPYKERSMFGKIVTESVALFIIILFLIRYPKRTYRRLKGLDRQPTRKTATTMPKIRRIDGED